MKITKHIELKRPYFAPTFKIVEIEAEGALLAGSPEGTETDMESGDGNPPTTSSGGDPYDPFI